MVIQARFLNSNPDPINVLDPAIIGLNPETVSQEHLGGTSPVAQNMYEEGPSMKHAKWDIP